MWSEKRHQSSQIDIKATGFLSLPLPPLLPPHLRLFGMMSLLVLFSLFVSISSDENKYWHPEKGLVQRHCGIKLSNYLRTLCNSNYYHKRVSEAAPSHPQVGDYKVGWSLPSMTKMRALDAFGRRAGKRGNIASECCYKGCTVDEYSSYCIET